MKSSIFTIADPRSLRIIIRQFGDNHQYISSVILFLLLVESCPVQPTFGSGTFEPIMVSSDESESSSQKLTNLDEKKTSISSTKHYKQRKTSLKFQEQQNSFDSGDDNQQEINKLRYHKKSRIPRALSPIKSKQTNFSTPMVSISNENFQNLSSSYKSMKYNNQQQQRNFPRSLSKSFSSSSSSSPPLPPPSNYCNNNSSQDDRYNRQIHRHNMAVSPLERDTTLKAEQQTSYSSSTISPIHSMKTNLRPPIIIHRGPRSFGFTLRAVKVFHGNTDYYTTQHVVVAVQGPAAEAGLKANDVITHVNDYPVAGLIHSEVVKLILNGSDKLSIRSIPSSETQIRTGGRRRSPSKQKLRYQQTTDKKSSTHNNNEYHSHQPHCQKYRINNSSGNNILNTNVNNTNKKHQHHNTSLFRRLSERKVARDIEAAAAAAAATGVSLTVPTTSTNTTNTTTTQTTTNTNTNILSSSLPLLSFNQLTLDPSEWPPLKSPTLSNNEGGDSLQSTLLPSIIKQKSQVKKKDFEIVL